MAISIRTQKCRMGLVNDDRLAGQYKLRIHMSWDFELLLARPTQIRIEFIGQARTSAGCKLARSANRPPLRQAYCLCAFRALARSQIPAETLPQTCPNFLFLETFIWNARSVNINAMSANPQGEARTSRSASNLDARPLLPYRYDQPSSFHWPEAAEQKNVSSILIWVDLVSRLYAIRFTWLQETKLCLKLRACNFSSSLLG